MVIQNQVCCLRITIFLFYPIINLTNSSCTENYSCAYKPLSKSSTQLLSEALKISHWETQKISTSLFNTLLLGYTKFFF